MLLFALFTLLESCAYAEIKDCQSGAPELQQRMSARLKKLYDEDQADRASPSTVDWTQVSLRDLKRRAEVGRIFGQGCFKEAEDYRSAAGIYQHGDTPDQYFQAFIWAKKASDLGDKMVGSMPADAIDRYLYSIGQKQLYGTELTVVDNVTNCLCLWPVESSFPTSLRSVYLKISEQEYLNMIISMYKVSASCLPIQTCNVTAKPSPAGTVPGLW